MTPDQVKRWRRDPVAFITEVLVNPETGKPFELYPAEVEFLRAALTPDEQGHLPFPEIVYSAPKKSGKTTLAAMVLLDVVVCLGGPFGEGVVVANDLEQATSRVFAAAARIVRASPLLRSSARVQRDKIIFPSTDATITAISSDAASAAGANQSIAVFDELWGFTSERSRRLWDELVPVPTRPVSVRLVSTYAGFSGESVLLEELYARAVKGEEIAPDLYRSPDLLAYWSHDAPAPWQTQEWREQMRRSLRPNAFIRMIENRFSSTESEFVPMEWWDTCTDESATPIYADPSLPVWAGLDASTKRDSTALVVVAHVDGKLRLVTHRIWKPTKSDPIDFANVEAAVLDIKRRFRLRSVAYDPYQLASTAQRLERGGVRMVELPQTAGNLTEAGTRLYELIRSGGIVVYPDPDIRLAVSRAVAIESSRGWRISKEKTSHHIDAVVALAFACSTAGVTSRFRASFHSAAKHRVDIHGGEPDFVVRNRRLLGLGNSGTYKRPRSEGGRYGSVPS